MRLLREIQLAQCVAWCCWLVEASIPIDTRQFQSTTPHRRVLVSGLGLTIRSRQIEVNSCLSHTHIWTPAIYAQTLALCGCSRASAEMYVSIAFGIEMRIHRA